MRTQLYSHNKAAYRKVMRAFERNMARPSVLLTARNFKNSNDMNIKDKVSRKVRRQVAFLGMPLEDPTWEDLFRYVMDKDVWFVMVTPEPDVRWGSAIVVLDKPGLGDSGLSMVEACTGEPSYDDAVARGLSVLMDELESARRLERRYRAEGAGAAACN